MDSIACDDRPPLRALRRPRASVTVPMRLTPDSVPSCVVRISMNRRPADVVNPPTDAWLKVRYVVTQAADKKPGRLDLLVRQPNCRVRVGQMIVE